MVMKIEPIARALFHLTRNPVQLAPTSMADTNPAPWAVDPDSRALREFPGRCRDAGIRVALTDPRGARFDQQTAREWACDRHLVLLCGHYEGVDDRVRQNLVTDEVSIGDYVLTGGELPALVIVDAVTRLQHGALGDTEAPANDSFADRLLEYPHYTRPREYAGWEAPEILLCGHHAQIEQWRRWHQLRATHERRPDLFEGMQLSPQDEKLFRGPEPTPPINERVLRRQSNDKKHEDTDGTGI